jgi:alpha-D-xyloside xylohydrolase
MSTPVLRSKMPKAPDTITVRNKVCKIQAISDQILRIRVRKDDHFGKEENEMVVLSPLPEIQAKPKTTKSGFVLKTSSFEFCLNKTTGRMIVKNQKGDTILETKTFIEWLLAKPAKIDGEKNIKEHLGDGTKTIKETVENEDYCSKPEKICRIILKIIKGSHFYGLGMTGKKVDMHKRKIDTFIAHSDADDIRTPFYSCTKGYGIFFRTTERAWFDMGETDSSSAIIDIEDAEEFECFIIVGNTRDCLKSYTWLTGRSPVLPSWVFGVWMGGYWKNQEYLLSVAQEFRKRKIPLDVMRQDSMWQMRHECDFKWDENFPNPESMIRQLKEMNLGLHLWIAHAVNYNCAQFGEAIEKDVFVKNMDNSIPVIKWWKQDRGGIIDFTNPQSVEWWKDLLKIQLRAGIIGYKTDGANEFYFITSQRKFFDGRNGKTVHNIYPVLYAKCVSDAQKEIYGTCMPIWIRSGYAGIQRYPVVWAGDQPAIWESIEKQTRAGISAGLCGISFWASDGGGFAGKPDDELYIRGFQFAFWNPVCQLFGGDREPWFFSEKACELFKKFAELRNRLNPYIVRLAAESAETGLPIMRHLMLEFPDDSACCKIEDQFMFGSAFLVAPIIKEGGKREIYFPKGEWVDIFSGEFIKGPVTKTMHFDIERYPVFARCGVIIPTKRLSDHIGSEKPQDIIMYRWKNSEKERFWRECVTGRNIESLSVDSGDNQIIEELRKHENINITLMPVNSSLI